MKAQLLLLLVFLVTYRILPAQTIEISLGTTFGNYNEITAYTVAQPRLSGGYAEVVSRTGFNHGFGAKLGYSSNHVTPGMLNNIQLTTFQTDLFYRYIMPVSNTIRMNVQSGINISRLRYSRIETIGLSPFCGFPSSTTTTTSIPISTISENQTLWSPFLGAGLDIRLARNLGLHLNTSAAVRTQWSVLLTNSLGLRYQWQ